MISGRTIARNTLLNLVGLGLPIVLALVCIPYTIHGLGAERFGILTVAWTAVGYLSLFDLGLGAALTKVVAEKLAAKDEEEIPSLAWSGIVLLTLIGVATGGIVAPFSPLLVHRVLNIPPGLEREAVNAFYLIAFSLPWVLSTTALRGLLESYQRFGAVNALRVPMGILTYLAPLLVLPFSTNLTHVMSALVIVRVVAWIAHLAVCLRTIPRLATVPTVRWDLVGGMARFGGWVTASNVSSTLMVYFDRFLIGAVLSMAAVTYYTTPYDTVTRIWMIPGAILGPLFPALSAAFVQDRERTTRLFDQAIRVLFLAIFPIVLVLVTFAREGLGLWLGAQFVVESTRVLQWLSAGVFINCIGMVAGAGLQGIGRPDLPGKANMLELPLYIGVLWWLLGAYGIEGAAIAWVLRVVVDTALLCVMAGRILPSGGAMVRRTAAMMVPAISVLACAAVLPTFTTRLAFLLAASLAFLIVAWYWVLTPEERRMVRVRYRLGRDVSAVGSTY